MAWSIWGRYSDFARRAVYFAQEETKGRGAAEVLPEDLLLGLLTDEENNAVALLRRLGIDRETLKDRLRAAMPPVGDTERVSPTDLTLAEVGVSAIGLATHEAEANGFRDYVGTEFLLCGIANASRQVAGRTLAELGCTIEALRETLRADPPPRERTTAPTGLVARIRRAFRN